MVDVKCVSPENFHAILISNNEIIAIEMLTPTILDVAIVEWQSRDVITVFHQKTSMHYLALRTKATIKHESNLNMYNGKRFTKT